MSIYSSILPDQLILEAVISLVESGAMGSKDFIRTENYNLRLKPAGARKMLISFPIY
ncbi:hypothetical protein MmTuc01_3218 [Methanosarcina mazei Tuc01]|uniref:Uncharacterized protein n=1 Tax=Methanosarcina mazei Tuc01 TaxID=1236903 RepID=M1Q836_METMZ|nr:hypothetical protein MmTuc01_3218 [Methanosarcina mazei Tuc01]